MTKDFDAAGDLDDISAADLSRAVEELTGQGLAPTAADPELQKLQFLRGVVGDTVQPRAADVTQESTEEVVQRRELTPIEPTQEEIAAREEKSASKILTGRITEEARQDPKVAEEIETLGVAGFVRKRQQELGEDRFFRIYLSEEGDITPSAKAVEEVTATDTESEPINRDVLETLGLTTDSAIGKSLLGRDLTRPGPRKELREYAKTADEDVQVKIDAGLENITERDLPDEVIIDVPGKIRTGITDKQLKEADLKKLRSGEFRKWFKEAKESGEKRVEKTIAGEFENLVGADPLTAEDNQKILNLVKEKRPSAKTKAAGTDKAKAQVFLGKMSRPVDSLYLALSDTANQNIVAEKTQKELEDATVVAKFLQGTGKTNANATLRWAEQNLSPQANEWIKETRTNLESRESKQLKAELDGVGAPEGQAGVVTEETEAAPEVTETTTEETGLAPEESYIKAKIREAQEPGPVRDVPIAEYQAERIKKLNDAIKKDGDIVKVFCLYRT